MDTYFDEDKGAKFNAGIAKLIRMGKLREGCHDARFLKDYNQWFTCLQGLRSEINSKLSKEINKKKPEIRIEREVAEEYENVIRLCLNNKSDSAVSFKGKEVKIRSLDIYKLLYDYELWLGDIEEKYKFGMPNEESAYAALR